MKRILTIGFLIIANIILIMSCTSKEITFKNLDFNTTCNTLDSICVWQKSYTVRSKVEFVSTSNNTDDFSLSMINTDNGVGFVEQSYILKEIPEETIFTFSAQIKTEDLKGKGAGLNIAIYDENNTMLDFADMGYSDYNYVKNTTDWQTKTLKVIIPTSAKTIKIGVIVYGTGKVFFDNTKTKFTKIVNRKASDYAKDYIDKASDSIMLHSLYIENINIEPIKQKAYTIAGNAKTGKDMYLAIEYMLSAINDKHAFFMPSDIRTKWEGNDENSLDNIKSITHSTSKLLSGYGYISVPGFHSMDSDLSVLFASTIQNQIQNFKSKKIKGFIVDLRNNDGGNMYPMLAGLEPLFSSDTLGFLVDVNNKREYWGRGNTFKKEQGKDYVQPTIKLNRIKNLPIAVLYGNKTGSSGEIIIISFIGNKNTKSFGQASMGLTTGNGDYELPDGSYMWLSSTYMADRNEKIYKSNVIPDEVINENKKQKDKTLEAALNWLKKQ